MNVVFRWLMYIAVYFTISNIAIWAIFSFISMNPYLLQWNLGARLGLFGLSCLGTFMLVMITAEIEDNRIRERQLAREKATEEATD